MDRRKVRTAAPNDLYTHNNRDFHVEKVPGLFKRRVTLKGWPRCREFSLSPVKQVIRQTYSSSTYWVEQVKKQEDGGTPKVVKWSVEIDEAEIEKEETRKGRGF